MQDDLRTDVTSSEQPAPAPATPEGEGVFGMRRRLGRGLNALLGSSEPGPQAAPPPETLPGQATAELLHIDVKGIQRNPFQPRKDFDLQALQELVESVKEHGVLQPLLVRLLPEGGFQLIAGERRWLAAQDAGLATVPCRVLPLEDRSVREVALIENLQRADLNDMEKAYAFQEYLNRVGCGLDELARKMGKDSSTISNMIRLLELPEFVKEAVRVGKISGGHARTLLPLESEAEQIAMCQRIQSEALSVRNTERIVREMLDDKRGVTLPFQVTANGKPAPKGSPPPKLSNQIASLQDQLREAVGVKVEIRLKGKDSGKMIIHFNSHDEFEHVVKQLRKAA